MQQPKTPKHINTTKQYVIIVKQWLIQHRVAVLIVLGALIITGVFCGALWRLSSSPSLESSSFTAKPKKVEKFHSPLTGLEVADEAATKQPTTGVMIENSPDARPQSGLKKAGIVYEAVAEGGITRFMAIYQQDKPALIGPVRSLRLYYLHWAAPYQAAIAHVGGSGNALDAVRSAPYRDIDQFFNAGSSWRTSDRYPPHNMYTSGEKLDQLNQAKGFTESNFQGFERTDGKAAETPDATQISVNFSSPLYATTYTYDATSNTYTRSLAGAPHTDREEGQITPSVIVAIEVSAELRPGNDGYEDLVTTGSGTAHIFQGGSVIPASWQKDEPTAPLQLKDAEGKTIKLHRGQTWIAAYTAGRGSVSWQ